MTRQNSPSDAAQPCDLFGEEEEVLETLPPATDPPRPVGRGNPPLHTRWKAGGPSPNPHGRPRKRRGGRLTALMEERVSARTGDETADITKRSVLDRIVLNKAITEGGAWLRIS